MDNTTLSSLNFMHVTAGNEVQLTPQQMHDQIERIIASLRVPTLPYVVTSSTVSNTTQEAL